MQVDNISAVSSVTKTYQYVESVQKVVPHQNIEGKDRIVQTNYVVTVYDNSDADTQYTVYGYEAGAFSVAYGDDDAAGSHTDVTYSVNDSLSLTVSDSDQADELIVVASYSMPF